MNKTDLDGILVLATVALAFGIGVASFLIPILAVLLLAGVL